MDQLPKVSLEYIGLAVKFFQQQLLVTILHKFLSEADRRVVAMKPDGNCCYRTVHSLPTI